MLLLLLLLLVVVDTLSSSLLLLSGDSTFLLLMVVEDDLRYVAPCVLVWMGLKIEFKTKERDEGNEWSVSWCVVVSTSSYVRSAGERTDHQDDDTGTSSSHYVVGIPSDTSMMI